MFQAIFLFFIGIIEMVIIAIWTKSVVKEQIWFSGVVSFINILIWYYVLETFVNDINNVSLVMLYAAGCAIGTMLASILPAKWPKKKKAPANDPVLAEQNA